MTGFSTLPFLVLAVAAFPWLVGRRAVTVGAINSPADRFLGLTSAAMLVWAGISAWLGSDGMFVEPAFLATLPGIWLPLVPLAVVLTPLLVGRWRRAVVAAGRAIPPVWFARLQMLRIAAVGTAMRTYRGEFPENVELLVGVPDLAFGLSAILIAAWAASGRMPAAAWVAWHTFGAVMIVPLGMIAINLSLPGPLQMWPDDPTFRVALEFPMCLAPTGVVPWLVLGNVWAIVSVPLGAVPGVDLSAAHEDITRDRRR